MNFHGSLGLTSAGLRWPLSGLDRSNRAIHDLRREDYRKSDYVSKATWQLSPVFGDKYQMATWYGARKQLPWVAENPMRMSQAAMDVLAESPANVTFDH